jgi:polysaccharide export outer membrane protein
MLKSTLAAALLLLCGPAMSMWAQTESLLIGPGDLIQVDVMDTPEMEQQVRVTDAGTVPLAYIGSVRVIGQTPASAAESVKSALVEKGVMRHPQVSVRVQEYATQDISVFGQVRTPGTYSITTPQTIVKVLSLAGGLTDMADRQITIKRHSSSAVDKFYVSNDPKGIESNLVMVNPGDTVLVPKAGIVYIMGDISKPGGYSISTNDSHLTILQAIAMAGSANKTSVQSHVRLLRRTDHGQTELSIHLDAIEKGKQPDIALQANDIVFVPFSWMKNMAMSSSAIAASTASAAIYTIP